MNDNVILSLISVTESAALAAAKWFGRGDKNAGDAAAVYAMREAFSIVPISGTIVIGEGEKDEAPMLYTGECVGLSSFGMLEYDIAIDPVEGTRLLALGRPNAISIMALSSKGTMVSFPNSFYMEKMVVPNNVAHCVDLHIPLEVNIRNVAKFLGKDISQMCVFVLDKPRHKEIIESIYKIGAKVQLHTDGDIAGALMALDTNADVDIMYGIGGSPEGLITACAVQSMGGELFARLSPQSEEEKAILLKNGSDLERIYKSKELVQSEESMVIATGISSGKLLEGVQEENGCYSTHSFFVGNRNKDRFYIKRYHCSEEK
ncbi:MAG: class II fructose-bisphosphatase [Desulfovibrionaceae bacterium]